MLAAGSTATIGTPAITDTSSMTWGGSAAATTRVRQMTVRATSRATRNVRPGTHRSALARPVTRLAAITPTAHGRLMPRRSRRAANAGRVTKTINLAVATVADVMKPTKYQRERRPISRTPVLCYSQKPLNVQYEKEGTCPDCGMWLKRGGRPHRPNLHEAFGRVQRYSDGSFLVISGEHPMPWCPVCEQSGVAAVHRTPLLGELCYGPVFRTAPRQLPTTTAPYRKPPGR